MLTQFWTWNKLWAQRKCMLDKMIDTQINEYNGDSEYLWNEMLNQLRTIWSWCKKRFTVCIASYKQIEKFNWTVKSVNRIEMIDDFLIVNPIHEQFHSIKVSPSWVGLNCTLRNSNIWDIPLSFCVFQALFPLVDANKLGESQHRR